MIRDWQPLAWRGVWRRGPRHPLRHGSRRWPSPGPPAPVRTGPDRSSPTCVRRLRACAATSFSSRSIRSSLRRLCASEAISIAFSVAISSSRSAVSGMAAVYHPPGPIPRKKCCGAQQEQDYSTASGARASRARTRRQSSPANKASNWAWFITSSPPLTAGQVSLCSSSRL